MLLVFSGLVIAATAANLQEERTTNSRIVAQTHTSWEVRGNFTEGKRLKLVIAPGDFWMANDRTDEYDFQHLAVYVNIIDSYGGKVEFEAIFGSVPTESGLNPALLLFLVKPLSNTASLTLEESNVKVTINGTVYYETIGGTVNYGGEYRAVINDTITAVPYEPVSLTLYEETVGQEKPYFFLVPVGATFMVAGTSVSLLTFRKHKRNSRKN